MGNPDARGQEKGRSRSPGKFEAVESSERSAPNRAGDGVRRSRGCPGTERQSGFCSGVGQRLFKRVIQRDIGVVEAHDELHVLTGLAVAEAHGEAVGRAAFKNGDRHAVTHWMALLANDGDEADGCIYDAVATSSLESGESSSSAFAAARNPKMIPRAIKEARDAVAAKQHLLDVLESRL